LIGEPFALANYFADKWLSSKQAAAGLNGPIIDSDNQGTRQANCPSDHKTRRLNNMPVSLANAQAIQLTDVESNENADKFLGAFQTSLASAHILKS
jgi:hypothetical protein